MPRMMLSMLTAIVVSCMVCLVPTQTAAHNLNGPHLESTSYDNSDNISLTCPSSITVDCDFNGIYVSYAEFVDAGGSANLEDGCEVVTFEFISDTEFLQDGCMFAYMREYQITTSCSNIFTCNQIVMLTDDDDPLITNCPADVSFPVDNTGGACLNTYDVPTVSATDGCSPTVTITNDSPGTFGIGTTLVTYTATDACGNSSTCVFNVTITDDTPLMIICPADIDVSDVCATADIPPYADVDAFLMAGGMITGNCSTMGGTFTIDMTAETIISADCPISIDRTYTISDDSGNSGQCTQNIIARDEDAPSFSVPADATVDCTDAQDTAVTGVPTNIVDNCDAMPTITFIDSDSLQLSAGCTGEVTFTRSWIATDQCMNSDTLVQMITTEDNTPPTASCRDTLFIYLDEDGMVDVVADSMDNGSFDDCSEITFSTPLSFVACQQLINDFSTTLNVSDGCGNSSSCNLIIAVRDTMLINLTSADNDTVSCIEDVAIPFDDYDDFFLAGGDSNDNCDNSITFSLLEADTTGVCPIQIVRIYEYTDMSGNSDTTTHTILIIDTEAPVITSCPDDIVITETDICDTLVNFGVPTFTDNCSAVTVTNDYTNDTSTSAVFTGGVTVVQFFATDACGNADTCEITIDIAADPAVTFPVVGVINQASEVPNYPDLDSFEMAGGAVNAACMLVDSTFEYEPVFEIQPDGCTALLTETVTFVNTSGDSIATTQMTTLMDTIAPILTGCNAQILIIRPDDCGFDTIFTLPTATDNFGIDTTFLSVSEFVDDAATVTFTARDLCGLESICEFDLLLTDVTSPIFILDDLTIQCDTVGAAPPHMTIEEFLTGPNAEVSDCRLDSTSFMFLGTTVDADGNDVYTYTISDTYGNDATITQTIFAIDTALPTFTSCPNDTTVVTTDASICGALVTLPAPVFEDNCNGMLVLTHNVPFANTSTDASGQYPIGTTNVTYTLTDDAGLTTTCSFSVTVNDIIPPDISCPPSATVDCNIANFIAASSLSAFVDAGGLATDACGVATVSGDVESTSTNLYTVTYTVTDNNGNTSTCDQTITVIDDEDPVLACNLFILVEAPETSCDTFLMISTPTATDNCGVDTIYNDLTLTDNASMLYSGTTIITWYAFDAAGNSDTCETTVMVIDVTGPVLRAPDTTNVMCIEMVAEVDTFITLADLDAANGSSFDNCGIDTFYFTSQQSIGDTIINRQYIAVDTTGNMSTVIQTIVIDDTTAPDFDAPVDVTIDCSIALDSLEVLGTVDSTMLMDNCGENLTLIYTDNTFSSGGCLSNDSIQRIWILTDESGNETRDTQNINKIDTVGPIFDVLPLAINDIECGDALPPTQILTATDDCNGSFVLIDTLPSALPPNTCNDYEINYVYTATDGCGNTTQTSVSFMRLADATAPVLVSANDQMLSTSPGICGVLVADIPRPEFSDDCSDMVGLSSDFVGDTYPTGTTNVLWTAQNDCGMTSTVTQVIQITDNEPPVVVCQDLNVSLGGDGIAIVQADTLAKTITDNCDHYFGNATKVRRIDNPTECSNDASFNNSVTFCCEDIGKTILVEVHVTDDAGNNNTCTSEITVNNAQGIHLISGLPDISISCEFLFDPTDLSIFGSFVEDPNDVEDIRIEDFFYPVDSIAGQDGAFINTCGLTTVTETSDFRSGTCGRETVIRSFLFDNGINTVTYVQTIYRSDVNLFNADGNDIVWPPYFEWDQCGIPAPDTSVSGAPVLLNNDNCSQVAVSFKDQLFNFPLTSCPFIKRKWKVIDWCQFDATMDPNPGMWTYEQFINVTNNVPPTILSACSDTLICAPGSSCSASLNFSILAEDDCMADAQNLYYQYVIDINNDNISSNDISGTAASFSHPVEAGVHEITWFVEDRCGNTSTCSFLATVRDCKDPTPICLTGLAIDLSGNTSVELWASDVDYGSTDNCTAQADLGISFSADVTDNLKTFTCADLGNQLVELWVTDATGNQSYCVAVINVQDNSGACNPNTNNLAGRIATETNVSIHEAMVSIEGAEMDSQYMTAEDGMYAFESIDRANDYHVVVDRDKDHLEGVTTLDLVLIQRHILGLSQLDSPYKLIAADINSDERLNASDLLALRKVILGVDDRFADNTSWRFVSKNDDMGDMEDPWPFSEDLILSQETVDIDADFVGVKIGDVNNTADELISSHIPQTRSAHILQLHTKDQKVKRDDQVLIDIRPSTSLAIGALQMTITYDTDILHLVDVVPVGINLRDYHMHTTADGEITIAWTSIGAQKISASTPLFQLVMEGEGTGSISRSLWIDSATTAALAYDEQDQQMEINLSYMDAEDTDILMHQNRPNPFLESTVVEFDLPESTEVTFKVFDGSGRLIHRQSAEYASGRNQITLGAQLGDYKGLLFLKMETAEFSDVRKMFRIE